MHADDSLCLTGPSTCVVINKHSIIGKGKGKWDALCAMLAGLQRCSALVFACCLLTNVHACLDEVIFSTASCPITRRRALQGCTVVPQGPLDSTLETLADCPSRPSRPSRPRAPVLQRSLSPLWVPSPARTDAPSNKPDPLPTYMSSRVVVSTSVCANP